MPPKKDWPYPGNPLSEQEIRVSTRVRDGKGNQEIAAEMFLSEDTVKTHLRRAFRKLSARDRCHAVVLAIRAGVVPLRGGS